MPSVESHGGQGDIVFDVGKLCLATENSVRDRLGLICCRRLKARSGGKVRSMDGRNAKRTTLDVDGQTVVIERVPGALIDAAGKPQDVVCCPDSRTIYVAEQAKGTFNDGARAMAGLVSLMRMAKLGPPVGQVGKDGTVTFSSSVPTPTFPQRR